MTEVSEKAKPGPKPKTTRAVKLAVAVHKIDGIEPGTPLALDSATYEELLGLEAIREVTDAESALYEKTPESVVKIVKSAAADIEAALD